MQVLTRGFLLSDACEKGGHPGRRERKLSSHAFSTDWRESFVPEPSSHAKGRTIRKVMGGEGNFRAARIFFRYQILCMNFI